MPGWLLVDTSKIAVRPEGQTPVLALESFFAFIASMVAVAWSFRLVLGSQGADLDEE